jgi:HK97 family phage portal protein
MRLASWLAPGASRRGGVWTGVTPSREPTARDLLAELKNTAWTCASLNAAVCASFAPRLYVRTRAGQRQARCPVRALCPAEDRRLRTLAHLADHTRSAERIEEVADHPLLDLLAQVNPTHNAFDLWEMTTLSQEVHGVAYWLLEFGPLGTPIAIWPVPAHQITPFREGNSPHLVDVYVFRGGNEERRFSPDQILAFRYPDPRDPYLGGLSPLRACFEQVQLTSELAAFKQAKFHNHALPDAIISAEDILGEEERDRLEHVWNARLRQGGAGRVIVSGSALRVQMLEHSMGDLAALADLRATKEDICNAFAVPLSYLTAQTNLANLQAAEQQHLAQAIRPRLRRRDEKLNEQLVPLFDPTGRLFVASDEPAPGNRDLRLRECEMHLRQGVVTINEVRSEQGRPPVPWGDRPWLPGGWAQPP